MGCAAPYAFPMPRKVVWFSCGAASAVAAKLAVDAYDTDCDVVYCDTAEAEHPDNQRFLRDVESWIGREVTIIRSAKYSTVDSVFEGTRYMAGVAGARCTVEMKKRPREAYQRPDDVHIFGYTADEAKRADAFEDQNPGLLVSWILIDQGVTKADCLRRLASAGIALPEMYGLGFDHNNCIGCVKATSAGYWNRVRSLFPDVFAKRARQSRLLGVKLVRFRREGAAKASRGFLDELPREATAPDDGEIDCGPVCQVPARGRGLT